MTYWQIMEEIQFIHARLGDSVMYTKDHALWDALSRLTTLVGELAAKQESEKTV